MSDNIRPRLERHGNQRTPNTLFLKSPHDWTDMAIKYIAEKTANFDVPENFHGWCQQFQKEFGYDRPIANLRVSISRRLEKIETLPNYTMLEKVQLLFVLSQPVSTNFLEILREANCTIELDETKRINLFCSADNQLIRSRAHGNKQKRFNGQPMKRQSDVPKAKPSPVSTSANQPSTSTVALKRMLSSRVRSSPPAPVVKRHVPGSSSSSFNQPSTPEEVLQRFLSARLGSNDSFNQPSTSAAAFVKQEEGAFPEDSDVDVKILHFPPNHRPTRIFYEEQDSPIEPIPLNVLPIPMLLESPTIHPDSKKVSLTLPTLRERQPPTTYEFLIHLLRTVEILDSPYLNTVQNRIQRALETCDTDPINMDNVVAIAQSVVICGCIYRMPEKYESIQVSRYLSALQHTILFLNSDQLESSREMLKGELRREDLGDVKITMDRVAQGIDQLLLAAAN